MLNQTTTSQLLKYQRLNQLDIEHFWKLKSTNIVIINQVKYIIC